MFYHRHTIPGKERVDATWLPTYIWIVFVFLIFMAFC